MSVEVVTDQEFQSVIDSNEKVVVKYFADWCGSCKLISPKYKRLASDERFENLKFIEVNAEHNEEARKAARVDNLPFFAVFKGGELLDGSATSKEDVVVDLLNKLN